MIRNKFLSTNLRRHITKRENWNANVPDMICWEAHKRSINKLYNTDKTRIHKFLHRCLPTNKKLHDIDQDHPAKCPACNEIETNDHVTACHNPRREKLRKELKSSTAKTMDKHNTHQHIKECILIGMEKFTNNDTTPIELTELSFTPSETIQQAITEQQAIGWTNFYRGRISTKWMDAQQEHARQNTHQGNQDTVQWASQITTTMWHGFLQIWEERKQDQHGRESSQQQATLRRTLLLKVDQLYSKIHTFDEEDKRIFSKPVAHWEQSSNKDIQDWLAIAEPITNKSASRARIRSSHEQPRITQFFSATKQATIQHHAKTHNMRPPRISEREG